MARALLILTLLSACGVDGAPTPPMTATGMTMTGMTMTGTVRAGIATDGG